MTHYLYIDTEGNREVVVEDAAPNIADPVIGLFQADDIYDVVCRDPHPYDLDGDLIAGGRIWVRRRQIS